MVKSKKAEIQREARDKALFDAYLRDLSQEEIGEQFGISQSTVSRAIAKQRAALVAAGLVDSKELIMVIEKRYEAVRKSAWESFRATGDGSFLRVIQDSLKALRDMHGLDAAKGINVHNVEDVAVTFKHHVTRSRREYEERQAEKDGDAHGLS